MGLYKMMNQSKADFLDFEAQCQSLRGNCSPKISQTKPIYIFGAGGFGKSVAKALRENNFEIAGFIETSPKQKMIDGIPVFSWDDLGAVDLSAQLLMGIYNRDIPFDALVNIANSAGFKDILMPWDVYAQFGHELGWRYWLSSKEIILDHTDDIKKTFELLSDEESKKTLLGICAFRLGLNNGYSSFRHEEEQYFNPLTLNRFANSSICSYVDCGAYNGDTFIEASNKLPLTHAYLFEPDPANFRQLVEMVKKSKFTPICLPLAVSDRYQILTFSGAGEGGAISLDGSVHIAATSLDELMPNAIVEFIKFDVEGAEVPAVMGATQLIKRSRPVLVLSLYHRPKDLWEIPALIASYCPGYKFYIRQHFNNSFDSVLYAIPQ
jgi:FkbM family methyltransferase